MSTYPHATQFIARLLLGVILIAHGWDKFQITGIEGVTGYFESIGVPAASIAAPTVATLEIATGALLILGLFTRVVGIVVALLMLGAATYAHISNGIYAADGGWELVGAIAAGALVLSGLGAGAWSLDALFGRRRATATV